MVGAFAGFMAGLLGIGGGIIIVPSVYMILKYFGIAQDEAMLMAVGTSMMVMIPTACSSSYAHMKAKAVQFDKVRKWALLIIFGVVFGGYIASKTPEPFLVVIYSSYMFIIAVLFFYKANFGSSDIKEIKLLHILEYPIVVVIGVLSALFGIGGGTFSVPFMNGLGITFKKSIATAAMIGVLIAVPGGLNYMLIGRDVAYEPFLLNVGYVSFMCVFMIFPTSIFTAYWGGKMVHIIPERIIKNSFACLLIIVAIKMMMTL